MLKLRTGEVDYSTIRAYRGVDVDISIPIEYRADPRLVTDRLRRHIQLLERFEYKRIRDNNPLTEIGDTFTSGMQSTSKEPPRKKKPPKQLKMEVKMLTPQEFLEKWDSETYCLVNFDTNVINSFSLSQETKEFLLQAGLPESAFPFLTFESSVNGGGIKLTEKYDDADARFSKNIYWVYWKWVSHLY